MTGWSLSHPSEKYEFVSWDDDIPNIWKINQMFQTTKQMRISPAFFLFCFCLQLGDVGGTTLGMKDSGKLIYNILAAAQARCEHTYTDTTWQSWKLYSQCGTPSYHCVDNPHEYYSYKYHKPELLKLWSPTCRDFKGPGLPGADELSRQVITRIVNRKYCNHIQCIWIYHKPVYVYILVKSCLYTLYMCIYIYIYPYIYIDSNTSLSLKKVLGRPKSHPKALSKVIWETWSIIYTTQ